MNNINTNQNLPLYRAAIAVLVIGMLAGMVLRNFV